MILLSVIEDSHDTMLSDAFMGDLAFYIHESGDVASSDPHHGIQFIPSDNLSGISIWHSIWHVF